MNRRAFLKGMLIASIAPAIIKIDTLMKIKPIIPILYADGIHDDSVALQAYMDGFKVTWPDGRLMGKEITYKRCRLTSTLNTMPQFNITQEARHLKYCHLNL